MEHYDFSSFAHTQTRVNRDDLYQLADAAFAHYSDDKTSWLKVEKYVYGVIYNLLD